MIILLGKKPKTPHKKCYRIIPQSVTAMEVKQHISVKAFSVLGVSAVGFHITDWTERRYKSFSRQNNNKNTQRVLLTSQAT